MSSVQEAIAVIDRTVAYLGRDESHVAKARYVEATLNRWVDVGVAADASLAEGFGAMREALTGFDADAPEGRIARLKRVRDAMDIVRSHAVVPVAAPIEAKALLFPEAVRTETPLPPGAPEAARPSEAHVPPGTSGAEPREGGEVRVEGASEPARGRGERNEPGQREPRGREGLRGRERGREERGPRGREGERSQEGERSARGRDGERAPEGERGRDGQRGRGGRDGDRGREGERGRDDRRSEERPERAPEPPPEPEVRTWPLGHPEATGQPISVLGVFTEEEIATLAESEIEDVAALLVRPPVAMDRAGERFLTDAPVEGPALVRGTVSGRFTLFHPAGRAFELTLATDRYRVRCRWVGAAPDGIRGLRPGVEVGIAGRVDLTDGGPVLYEGEIIGVDGRGGDWLPRYEVPGIPDARMRAGVRMALQRFAEGLGEHLPPEILDRHRLVGLSAALRDVHFPSNVSRKGRSRMAFDELLQFQLGASLLRQRGGRDRGTVNPVVHGLIARAVAMDGWQFTDAQEAAFDDIRRDLRRTTSMSRLLQGDAGCGKQLVVQATMLVLAGSQHQSFYAAPDALAAEHRCLFAEAFLKSAGVEPVLLNGSTSRAVIEGIKKGDHLVVFGTHAHLVDLPAFRKLGLVVVEEGPGSHGAFVAVDDMATRPDLLVLTPTPVPAAVALTVYGHLALTAVGLGPGAGAVARLVPSGEREGAFAEARARIEAGQQALLVFPLVRGQDLLSPSEARRLAEVLSSEQLPGARIGIFSGAMSREERFRAYDDFLHRRTDLLLATTYVEHGPRVPDATIMLVEHAHLFDLARLHRLRAHVAGGFKPGLCLLVAGEDADEETRRQLELVVAESDGYQIAELDLAARGLPALLGDRASETPAFAWADPVKDRDLLVRTRAEAGRLLQLDPGLRRRAHRGLLQLVRNRVGEEVGGDPAGTVPGAAPEASGRKRRRRRR